MTGIAKSGDYGTSIENSFFSVDDTTIYHYAFIGTSLTLILTMTLILNLTRAPHRSLLRTNLTMAQSHVCHAKIRIMALIFWPNPNSLGLGAPGESKVFVYLRNSDKSWPTTETQVISQAGGNKFGGSLSASHAWLLVGFLSTES